MWHFCQTYHLPAEGRPPGPSESRKKAALLLWAPTRRRVIAKAWGVWTGRALLSWRWRRGRREEESSRRRPWSPVPLEAPGPAEVKKASSPLLLEWRQWWFREAGPHGPQSPGIAGQSWGGLVTSARRRA